MWRWLIALAALLGSASPAMAWWEYGHQIVARIAMATARPSTQRAVRRLLAHSDLLETPTCPARTIDDASVWADCVKQLKDRYSYAYSWHFMDVDVCGPFDIKASCPDGNCVARQIERDARLLRDRKQPLRIRVEALFFLIHFMGDLHQPLHVGDRHDKGGNAMKADYGYRANTNLHSIWDGLLADRAISTPPADAAGILSEVAPAERAAMAQGSAEDWTRESWQVAHDAYAALLGGDGCGAIPRERPVLDNVKIEALVPVLRRQVARGGIRLARMLDEALG
jgi:hypothetical protein